MKKAILFDLDGTLLNTSIDIYKTLNESLALFRLPQVSLADTIKFVGDGAKNLIIRAVGENTDYIEDVYGDYIVRFAKCGNANTKLYDGEHEFLTEAKNRGIKTAIVTNKPQNATEAVCGQLLSQYNFDIIIGKSDRFPLKPNPASCLYAMNRLGVERCDCLFIGDGETDVKTAQAAQIDCISALWGYRSKQTLQSFGAQVFANNYSDLAQLVFNLS